ncbi:protein CUSTOS isoform 1-T1 [Molossus nigricans]
MTAPRSFLNDLDSSGSSSDTEELARCREAAVPAWGLEQRPGGPEEKRADAANNQLPTTHLSLRHKVDEHEQDGNELQTTPEFRAHVAKKLGALLDSSITISEVVKEPTKAEVQEVVLEDDGFRLFFTSVPEGPEKKAAPQPRRKRLPSSSSSGDSDEWRRCQEAAVSASDILQESALHGPVKVEKETKKKKKKSKKEAKKESSTDLTTATITTSRAGKQERESAKLNGDHVSLGTKKKKRKKKTKRASEASPFPPSQSTAAVPAN